MHRHKVRVSWMVAVLATAGFLAVSILAGSGPVYAQAQPGADAAGSPPPKAAAEAAAKPEAMEHPAEEIVVTGTRIERTNVEEYAPIAVVTSEQLERAGVTNVQDLLIQLPTVTLQGISRNDNNGGNGLAFVDLRNLGPGRTLVLVDGKRFVNSTSSVEEAVDLNNIPVSMIDRVEVLLDGASAVYGSDAIGGVVNILLKHDIDGFDVQTYAGVSDDGDGEEGSLSGTWGANTEKGNVSLNATYSTRGEVKQEDRDWAKNPVVFAGFDDDGSIFQIIGSSLVPEGRVGGLFFRPDPDTGASFQEFDSLNPDNRFNYGREQWLVGNQKRFSLTGLGHFDLNENLRAYLEGSYTNRTSRNVLAPQPLGGGTTGHPNGFLIPTTNPFIPADFLATLDPGTTEFDMARRLNEVGNRVYDVESNVFRVVSGLKGDLLKDYDWDLFFNYGRSDNTVSILNSVNFTRVLETADPELCALNADVGCVPGNYFGAGSLTPDVLDYISYTDVEVQGLREIQAGASVSGHAFKLPAGGLGVAAGLEFRDESGFDRPSATVVGGDSAGNGQDPTAGSYDVFELFGELSVPVLSGVTLAHELTVDLAGRWSNYNTFGSDETYRAGLSYAPIEGLRLRGIVATAFRAPGINDLFGGRADSYEVVEDPCNDWDTNPDIDPTVRANCEAEGVPPGYNQNDVTGDQIRTNIGGNPDLDAETAVIYNLGMVVTPVKLQGLSLTADYYNIQIDNAITNPDPQFILSNCYSSAGLSSPNCQFVGRASNGSVNRLEAFEQNIGKIDTKGVDVAVDYLFDLDRVGLKNIGQLDLGWHANYLLLYKEITNGEEVDFTGKIQANLGAGSFGNLRWYQSTSFLRDNWKVTSILRYLPEAHVYLSDPEVDPFTEVNPALYWDLVGQLTLHDRWTFTAGINNVADVDPPFLLEGGTNAATEGYDFVGRFFFGSVGVKL